MPMTNEQLALEADFAPVLLDATNAAKASKGNFLPSGSQEGLALIQHVQANQKSYSVHVE